MEASKREGSSRVSDQELPREHFLSEIIMECIAHRICIKPREAAAADFVSAFSKYHHMHRAASK